MSVSEANPALAVVLLARPGKARERLREALAHADVQLVLEDDPTTLALEALRDARPGAVVVALEPAIEDALERLDPVLSSPALTLVFDEADVAARRDGWDAQRWGRHLAAKLHGHQQVLPPGSEDEPALALEPGLPLTPAQLHADAPLARHLQEADERAPALPSDTLYPPQDAEGLAYQPPAQVSEPVSLEEALAALQPPAASVPPPVPEQDAPVAAERAPAAPPVSFGDHTHWSLVDEDNTPPPVVPAVVAVPEAAAFASSALSLVDLDAPADGARAGAVLVLAGIGGPDALRRLPGALPQGLRVPVLVHMRLDGGRYGNLVKQMARVSPLPVLLAEPGQSALPGQVHILSDDTGLQVQRDGLQFIASGAGLQLSTLDAAHSAVVLLSGAELGHVDAALDLAAAGAWVAGQTGEGCYDPAAATAVVAAGMAAGEPQELAQVIAARWAGDEGDAA
ncbi:MAG: Chemotaxis response regulator protein-glutamate methylesterase [Stenotrophomonas maltophilia]|uniref:Chemotaxis response regulator protein-glutamate methylesterase n=1 Tax=Stenotrophomonas maltophilia TaxID=40324 RepID=A0A7V8FKC8_STEMA|nr:MAG: Chemotaxis response regulator protein-glutamate methylesterase [Stenotrophomonas maltophilia]